MTYYPWRCHVCELANERESVACTRCGFPSYASGRAIAAARAQFNPVQQAAFQQTQSRSTHSSLLVDLAPLPPLGKVVGVFGLFVAAAGGLLVKLTPSLVGTLAGLALLVAGISIFAIVAAPSMASSSRSAQNDG